MYEYRVRRIIKVVDGDTIDAVISLGFGMEASFRFRLAAIDTPEVYGSQASVKGTDAKLFTERWLADRPSNLKVQTFKGAQSTTGIGDGAFGRWLAAFVDSEGNDLASALREAGYSDGA